MISLDSLITTSSQQVFEQIDGEGVILHLESGIYYSLDSVGVSIWNLIQQPKSVGDIKGSLLAEYDVEPQQCEQELLALVEDLAAQKLIEIKDATIA